MSGRFWDAPAPEKSVLVHFEDLLVVKRHRVLLAFLDDLGHGAKANSVSVANREAHFKEPN